MFKLPNYHLNKTRLGLWYGRLICLSMLVLVNAALFPNGQSQRKTGHDSKTRANDDEPRVIYPLESV